MPGEATGPRSPYRVPALAGAPRTPTRRDVEARLQAEGLTPRAWSHTTAFSYGRHVHEHHKVLCCVSGSIVFHTDAGDVALGPGDRMELPSGVEHGATVGADGVECVEAYRPEGPDPDR